MQAMIIPNMCSCFRLIPTIPKETDSETQPKVLGFSNRFSPNRKIVGAILLLVYIQETLLHMCLRHMGKNNHSSPLYNNAKLEIT